MFDPMHYVTDKKYGKYTRMRALAAAYDANMITLDEMIEYYHKILLPHLYLSVSYAA